MGRSVVLVVGLLIFIVPLVFGGTASGTFTLDGNSYEITASMAKTSENPFDKTKKDVLLLLTDQAVNESDFDPLTLDTLAEQGKIHGIMVRLSDHREATGLFVLGVVQRTGNFICGYDSTTFEDTRVAGRVFLEEPDKSFGREYIFDIQFDTTIAEAVEAPLNESNATPLPSGGGEPGKAYLEYEKAIQTAKPETLKKYLVPEQAKKLDDPEAVSMLGLMKLMRAREIKIVNGFLHGDRATLVLEGKDPVSNMKTTGTVRMRNLNGQWVLERESWSSTIK